MQKVVFDSSFLMAVVETPTTWYEDMVEKLGRFEPVVLDCVRDELTKVSHEETKRARYARLAMDLTKDFTGGRCGSLSVDDEIASYSRSAEALVASLDGRLLARLEKLKVGTISLRSGRVFFP